jgi:XTP/dITP diphosphohydrolase
MKDLKKIFIATSNKGKIKELNLLFNKLGIETVPATDFAITPPEETETTFLGNAVLKAKYYSKFVPYPCFADDSGLCVDALDGEPGIYSARWSKDGDFTPAIAQIKTMLNEKNLSRSNAKYVCALALYKDGNLNTAEGILEGEVVFPSFAAGIAAEKINFPAGKSNGCGYDPIFIPNGYDQTLTDLGVEIKNQISHRVKAFNKLFNS